MFCRNFMCFRCRGNIDEVISTYGLQPLSMLRTFCLKTGVLLVKSLVGRRNKLRSEEFAKIAMVGFDVFM